MRIYFLVYAASFGLLLARCPPSLLAQWLPLNPVKSVEAQTDGALLVLENGYLRFQVCSDSILHITYSLERNLPERPDFLVVKKSWPRTTYSLQNNDPQVVIFSTSRVKIVVTRASSSLVFYDAEGHKLAQESTRSLSPTEVNGEKTYHSERFVNMWDTQEALYGLGQHQAGVLNYRGESVDISQDNTNISNPLLLSSNGYGIFWNNSSPYTSAPKWPIRLTITSSTVPSSTRLSMVIAN